MTRKWGSCSTAGTVTLADDLETQARSFQDYVIVHELLHLKVPNHGKVFKALMSLHLPGWRRQNARGVERLMPETHRHPERPRAQRRKSA